MSVPTKVWAATTANEQQKIKLLSNRFRVDQAVESIIFIIERKPGSAPIILVRPDGSKLYSNRNVENVRWMDGNSGDMIEITGPMIGPWQIIGDILPSSEVRLATSLSLKIDHIPDELFIGEDIKLTAKIEFNNELLALGRVDDLIGLNVFLRSKDIVDNDNFGAGTFIIGDYTDNGLGFDERRGDGVFTGRLNLDKPYGPYTLLVRAENKVFEREVSQELFLRPKPVKVDLISAAIGGSYALRFITNAEAVDLAGTAIQIKVKHPDNTVEQLSVNGLVANHLFRLSKVSAPGRYKIDVDVFGKTTSGRDFKVSLKQLKFKIAAPAAKQAEEEQITFDKEREAEFKKQQRAKQLKEKQQREEKQTSLIIIIVMVNVIILLLGGLLMWFFLRTKKPKVSKDDKGDDAKEKKKAGDKEKDNKK
ncbi:TIGR03503 family protein [Psychrobium sp. 1_MG-2023]|uniref:TIGR03503 family protein n=1 Tax=Psychrobium sp. 1_MG-2023 TaxID=3062624 RepID=UPI001290A2ED|nr:TIGR03503 family protein [Psychrobium sp. 1_MG-2023]MDP2560637.1 TIGR03503 family protein [Psychrobium sp. 1_MG-2023]